MVEVYPACSSRELSAEFILLLTEGWNEVFKILQGIGVGELSGMDGVEITLLDDDEMARIHGEFLNDASPTDVITFDHGELLVGVETAQRQAGIFESSPDREVALYGIHGMLHLAGFDDHCEKDAQAMAIRQMELLEMVFSSL
ncbi:rRNA maturation RNase YbeY [Verrucomicrobiaceae bacterium 227]